MHSPLKHVFGQKFKNSKKTKQKQDFSQPTFCKRINKKHVSFSISRQCISFAAAAILGQNQVVDKNWQRIIASYKMRIKRQKTRVKIRKEKAALRCYLQEPLVFCKLHVSEKKKQKIKNEN